MPSGGREGPQKLSRWWFSCRKTQRSLFSRLCLCPATKSFKVQSSHLYMMSGFMAGRGIIRISFWSTMELAKLVMLLLVGDLGIFIVVTEVVLRKEKGCVWCIIQCIIYTADRSQLFANLGWVSGQSTPFVKNCHLWCKVESDLFLTNVNTMLAEIKKLTMKYLVKFGLNLKTLTYSSMERKPSLSLSACSNAKQSYIRLWNLRRKPENLLVQKLAFINKPFIKSSSFLLSAPFCTIRLVEALNI